MESQHGSDAALTIAVALASGLVATVIAHHARLPAIVLLLFTGALLGPDVLGLVQPHALGEALHTLVGFAVAVILFEGGLNLNLRRILRESRTIRGLITLGALVTVAGAALAARTLLGWDARFAILFGTLVIVTGPTVIGPLVRRIRLKKSVRTVLEAEGVLIDPIGAIAAVAALEVALQPSFVSLFRGILDFLATLGVGSAVGLAGGWILTLLLRPQRLVPEGLENVFSLSMVLLLFHAANSLRPESGIAAVTLAGVVVANTRHRSLRDLMEFKEQLTVLLIGMLFVILAADVRFAQLRELGWAGLAAVLALMLVVRPLGIVLCTWGSDLSVRERIFLSWIAPRGIVAAAVASLFAGTLDRAGIPGGQELKAMVFLVIAVTVTVQGLTGGLLARLLGLRRTQSGYAILGAGPLGRLLGRILRDEGEEVLFLDSNADASHAAEDEGFRVVFGNALEESTMLRAGLDGVAGGIAMTSNEEVNLLFARTTRAELKVPRSWAALHSREGHVTPRMVVESGAAVLFGDQKDLSLWDSCVRRNFGQTERWRWAGAPEPMEGDRPEVADDQTLGLPSALDSVLLPLVRVRGRAVTPWGGSPVRRGDEVVFLLFEPKAAAAREWLESRGWEAKTVPVEVES